jgi:hypothetical protein
MSKWIKQSTAGVTSIATTSTTDEYIIAAKTGKVTGIKLNSLSGLAAHDSNYITPTVTNLGQADASGTTALLAASDANTTKATGGSALTANVPREFTLSSTAANLNVTEGDVLRCRATATGTLAGAVTRPMWEIEIKTVQR